MSNHDEKRGRMDDLDESLEETSDSIDNSSSTLDDVERRLEDVEERTEEVENNYDQMEEQTRHAETVIEDLAGALEEEQSRRRFLGRLKDNSGLIGVLGLVGLGGLYGSTRNDEAEWQNDYEVLLEDNDSLEYLGRTLSETVSHKQDVLASEIEVAVNNHRKIGLGLNPNYADVGVKRNEFADYTLQSRTNLDDTYRDTIDEVQDVTLE